MIMIKSKEYTWKKIKDLMRMESLLLLVNAYGMTCSANFFFFPKVFLSLHRFNNEEFEIVGFWSIKTFLHEKKEIMLYLFYLEKILCYIYFIYSYIP